MPNVKAVDADQWDAGMVGVADAIREKGETAAKFASAEEMRQAVLDIPRRKNEAVAEVRYERNGQYLVKPDSPSEVLSEVRVEVSVPKPKPEIRSVGLLNPFGNHYATVDVEHGGALFYKQVSGTTRIKVKAGECVYFFGDLGSRPVRVTAESGSFNASLVIGSQEDYTRDGYDEIMIPPAQFGESSYVLALYPNTPEVTI